MAVSGTRRGPGWWMDRNGGWNPPELWPETTPPLPGWVRGENGRWEAPPEVVDDPNAGPVIDLTIPTPESNKTIRTPRHMAPPAEEIDASSMEVSTPPLHMATPDEPSQVDELIANAPSLNLSYAEPASVADPARAVEEVAQPRRWGTAGMIIAVVIALLVVVLLVL